MSELALLKKVLRTMEKNLEADIEEFIRKQLLPLGYNSQWLSVDHALPHLGKQITVDPRVEEALVSYFSALFMGRREEIFNLIKEDFRLKLPEAIEVFTKWLKGQGL